MSDTGVEGFIGVFLSSLIPAFLFSRAFHWLMQSRGRGFGGALIANALSLGTIAILAGLRHMASGEGLTFVDVMLRYLLPQVFWLGFDLVASPKPPHIEKEPAA